MATRAPARRRRPLLAQVLALHFAVAAGLLLLMVAFPLRAVLVSHERQQIRADSETLARAAAALVREQMLSCEQVLSQVHNALLVYGDDSHQMSRLLDQIVASTPSLETVYVVDGDDRIVSVGLSSDRASVRSDYLGLDLSGQPVVKAARRAAAPAWSDVYRSVVTGTLSAMVAERRGSRMVVAHLGLDQLQRVSDQEIAGATERCLGLFDAHGNVVISEQEDSAVDRLLWLRLMRQWRQAGAVSAEVEASGRSYLASIAQVPGCRWWVLVCQHSSNAFRPMRRVAALFWSVVLLAALLAGLGGWVAAARVIRPLSELHGAVASLASGNYEARLPDGPYVEVADLSRAFEATSKAVRDREADLRSVAATISCVSGRGLYEAIAAETARLTGGNFVLLTEFVAGDRCRSLVALADGAPAGAIEYDLAATPCAEASRRGFVVYEREVQALFPDDADLVALGAESYVGAALHDEEGHAIGVLLALSRRPMVVPDQVREALRILATRAAGELAREHAAREREALEERLQQASRLEAIGQLAGGVAHDFNNLLTSIRGYADLLAAGPLSEEQQQDLEYILQATGRATALTRQLLTFSRRQLVQPRTTDLAGVVGGMRGMLTPLVGEEVSFGISVPAEPVWVVIDDNQLEQVVMNLVVNARAATPLGGSVTVELSAGSGSGELAPDGDQPSLGHALLTVTDTGSGMDEATRDRMFEPFFTTRPPGEGTGLGLSTVYGIVRQAHGQVTCESAPGEGTVFRVWLPLAEPPREPVPSVTAPASASVIGAGTQEIVLVVEDAEAVRRLARRLLERNGYRVLEAGLPSVALEILRDPDQRIDLLFTDVVMPELDGVELADLARSARPDLAVLFTSGYADQTRAEQALARLDARLLAKPYTAQALMAAVREKLEGNVSVGPK